MKLTGKILKSLLFLWAAAILWIYIGSLVNFHQHKIWGRALLPQLIYAKRDKDQSINYNKLIKPDLPRDINPGSLDSFSIIPASSFIDYFTSSSSYHFSSTAEFILIKRVVSSDGLRAPPLS
jgi:hypothetical protein